MDPYAAGYRAWHQNDDFNPYDLDSQDYDDWNQGFDDAESDDSDAA